jgi:hypothetical protein
MRVEYVIRIYVSQHMHEWKITYNKYIDRYAAWVRVRKHKNISKFSWKMPGFIQATSILRIFVRPLQKKIM